MTAVRFQPPSTRDLRRFHALLDDAIHNYGRMFRDVQQHFPHVSVLCHGYDYPIPDGGRWLGAPMEEQEILDKKLQRDIAIEMMDAWSDMIADRVVSASRTSFTAAMMDASMGAGRSLSATSSFVSGQSVSCTVSE